MARIRTIKPEFPQSESMGRVSRDARLLFIQLWTLCDDDGRTRAASRMLASLLYPYDDDAPSLIEAWLKELENEGCIVRYQAEGSTYLQVCNWLSHQKIDRPSKSKIPAFDESSRILANPREVSSLDQGRDQGRDQGSISSDRPDDMPQGFTLFWDAWPKTARKTAKAECLKRWRKRGLEQLSEKIVAHVEAMKKTEPWRTGFEPAPLTYINQSRWEDDLPPKLKAVGDQFSGGEFI